MSCSMELVQMLDDIDNEKKKTTKEEFDRARKELQFALKNSKCREEEQVDENNKLKTEIIYLKCIMKNMILSVVCTHTDDLEWNVRRDYGMNYSDEYNTYKDTLMKEQIEELNDTDWNESEPSFKSVLEYEPLDENIYLHFDDDDEERSEVFSDEE